MKIGVDNYVIKSISTGLFLTSNAAWTTDIEEAKFFFLFASASSFASLLEEECIVMPVIYPS